MAESCFRWFEAWQIEHAVPRAAEPQTGQSITAICGAACIAWPVDGPKVKCPACMQVDLAVVQGSAHV